MQFSVIASGVVAALVGFGGTLSLIVEAARRLGATPDQTSSWVASLCLGIAATSAWLSLRYRMPIVTAWSLAGAALILGAPSGTTMSDAVGAFIFAAALMVLAGAAPILGRLIALLPVSIASGMLAGVLLRFVLALFAGAQTAPGLVLPLLLLFLLARLLHPASAPLVVLAAALPVAALEGYGLPLPFAAAPLFVWMPPSFSLSALVGLGIPLFLVTMTTQQISGAAVLRSFGYAPPVQATLVTTGLATVALAPLGAYSINLSSVTAAICTSPDAHPDPAKRWLAGTFYALSYLLFTLGSASLAAVLAVLPPVLMATVAGSALLGPFTGALASALHREQERFAAVLAFAVTASGLTLAGVGGAFWGLLAGVVALWLEQRLRASVRRG